ncbi:MAG: hypothetical protein GF344_19395 [Chitinivibrionales bacterium]|nr:hypothetical protein [Chitinivibrionales bacterium]MBD3358790.1 hypothetical protein [Chitinivibrionales bacterium]
MSVHGIDKSSAYLSFLHENHQEAQLLLSELLISVTSYFRDPDAFAALQDTYLPSLIEHWPENREFRVWDAACATGEEAYSIAIVLDELRRRFDRSFDIRIFATDLDVEALLEDHTERLDEEGRDYLHRIGVGTKKMQRIIDGLLTLSRIGRQEIHREQIDLSAIVRDHLEEVRGADPERNVEIIVPNNIRVDADPRLMHLAQENLVRNAWKFTAEKDSARIEFGMFEQDGQRVYFVRDNGAGFDNRFAERIFAPFKRVHGEREFGGTGIGLSIVQRVISRHGGSVWAEGEVGTGATFYFTLNNKQ